MANRSGMALAPLAQRGEDRGEISAGDGEHVLIPRRAVAVSPAFDDPGLAWTATDNSVTGVLAE